MAVRRPSSQSFKPTETPRRRKAAADTSTRSRKEPASEKTRPTRAVGTEKIAKTGKTGKATVASGSRLIRQSNRLDATAGALAGSGSLSGPKKSGSSRARAHQQRSRRTSRAPTTIPKRWVKALVGLFLLPFAWVLSKTFFGALAWASLEQRFWETTEFSFFAGGGLLWLVIFFAAPKPLWVYVFGHELTHVLTVWLMGGRVEGFQARSEGGYVLTDKVNTWIALSPYFIPLYSVFVLVIYLVAGIFWETEPFYPLMLGFLGFTWAFHLSFTCWMIPKGQTDLAYGGHFFSLVIIYLANVLLLSALLVAGSEAITPGLFAEEFFYNMQRFWEQADGLIRLGVTPAG